MTLAVGLAAGCGAKTGLFAPEPLVDAGLDAAVPCIEIPFDGGPVRVGLEVEAEVGRADVVLLVDVTGSMGDELAQIRARLRDRIIPALRASIPDSEVAVATFGDFPVGSYGAPSDVPFALMTPRTSDTAQMQAAVDAITLGDGRDTPESHVEALYQLATGEGLAAYIPASLGCPMGGVGYACLRSDALPVVLLFTDAEMHNGPGGKLAYSSSLLGGSAHTFEQAMDALNAMGAKVMGFDSGDGVGRPDLQAVATRTGTLDASGRPLVFNIGARGNALDTEVVRAIETLAGTLVQDIDAFIVDADPTDGANVTDYVEAIAPVSASPTSGVASIDLDAGVFREVEAGTRLTFEVIVKPGSVAPGPTPLVLEAEVIFRGEGRNHVGSRFVHLVIPAADGAGCGEIDVLAR